MTTITDYTNDLVEQIKDMVELTPEQEDEIEGLKEEFIENVKALLNGIID